MEPLVETLSLLVHVVLNDIQCLLGRLLYVFFSNSGAICLLPDSDLLGTKVVFKGFEKFGHVIFVFGTIIIAINLTFFRWYFGWGATGGLPLFDFVVRIKRLLNMWLDENFLHSLIEVCACIVFSMVWVMFYGLGVESEKRLDCMSGCVLLEQVYLLLKP